MSGIILVCGECVHWFKGVCLMTGTIGVNPQEMDYHALDCDSFESTEIHKPKENLT